MIVVSQISSEPGTDVFYSPYLVIEFTSTSFDGVDVEIDDVRAALEKVPVYELEDWEVNNPEVDVYDVQFKGTARKAREVLVDAGFTGFTIKEGRYAFLEG